MRILIYQVIIIVIIFTSCSQNERIENLAKDYCDCCNEILNSEISLSDKRLRLEKCNLYYLNSINKFKENERKLIDKKALEIIEKQCPECIGLDSIYKFKREADDLLIGNIIDCKEYLSDGTYLPIGMNDEIVVTRKDSFNIVEYPNMGYKSISVLSWIDECSYELVLIESNRPDLANQLGLKLLVRIIKISGDTIDYDIESGSQVFSQKMIKIESN